MSGGVEARALLGALVLAAVAGGVSAVGAVATAEQFPGEGRLTGLALGATAATAVFGGFTPWWHRRVLEAAGFESIHVDANAGSFRFFSQESLRFVAGTMPFRRLPLLPSLLWLPFWLLLLPVLAGLIPLAAALLDRYDREQRFTIGYHVTAVRRAATPVPGAR